MPDSGRSKEASGKPRLPPNSPQSDHEFTITSHPKTQKSPAKTIFLPPKLFRAQKAKN